MQPLGDTMSSGYINYLHKFLIKFYGKLWGDLRSSCNYDGHFDNFYKAAAIFSKPTWEGNNLSTIGPVTFQDASSALCGILGE